MRVSKNLSFSKRHRAEYERTSAHRITIGEGTGPAVVAPCTDVVAVDAATKSFKEVPKQ